MNYRQWKKNYKKKHGYNPPFEEDKRQQAKAAKEPLGKHKKALAAFIALLGNWQSG